MKNSKISTSFVLTMVLALGSFIPALAEESIRVSVGESVDATSTSVRASSSVNSRIENEGTTSDDREGSSSIREEGRDESRATTTGSTTAAENRSVVATFVQRLLSVANREGGIGSEVRVIAQEQSGSSSTTRDAIAKVESRSGIRAFLIGTDYRNTGVIRSELASTAKRIERLSEIASSTSISAQSRIELRAQIKSLTDEGTKLDAFINAHEDQFSLFGWFVRLFNR